VHLDPARARWSLELGRPTIHQWDVGVLTELVNFLYPPRSAACGAPFDLSASFRVCDECLDRAEPIPEPRGEICGAPLESSVSGESRCTRSIAQRPAFRRDCVLARYRSSAEDEPGTMPALLRRHKYGLDQAAGRALAEYIDGEFPINASDYDLVVPIPRHRRLLWWHGFNQAALLAAEVAHRMDLPLDAASVVRSRFTPSQTARDHDDRQRNVARACSVRRPAATRGRRVLLVDDVMTTGATADECARVIIAAGAQRVDVFTLARVL
jgi:ComF family protein